MERQLHQKMHNAPIHLLPETLEVITTTNVSPDHEFTVTPTSISIVEDNSHMPVSTDSDEIALANNYITPIQENPELAAEVRRMYALKGWKGDDAREVTGLTTGVLNQLKHGRSVRLENLQKWAEAVDGPDGLTKWLRIANKQLNQHGILHEANPEKTPDPQMLETAMRLSHLPNRHKLALNLIAACLEEASDPKKAREDQRRALLDKFQHTNPQLNAYDKENSDEKPILPTLIYGLGFLGTDAAGVMQLITKFISSNGGDILEGDSLARAGLGSVFLRFRTLRPLNQKNFEDQLEKLLSEALEVNNIPADFRLVLKEERFTKAARYRFGIYLCVENQIGMLNTALKIIKKEGWNITDICQRLDSERSEQAYALLAVELINDTALTKSSYASATAKIFQLQESLIQTEGVLDCLTEHLGATLVMDAVNK